MPHLVSSQFSTVIDFLKSHRAYSLWKHPGCCYCGVRNQTSARRNSQGCEQDFLPRGFILCFVCIHDRAPASLDGGATSQWRWHGNSESVCNRDEPSKDTCIARCGECHGIELRFEFGKWFYALCL